MKTITFYSYKGGVGRSLALANIASRLSEFNKKVCLLDFDLEAPGLQFKFKPLSSGIEKGIVDYIYEFTNSGILPRNIADYVTTIETQSSHKQIQLIPAGNIDSKVYWKKLSSINWYDLLYQNENGLTFFLDLKEKIKKELNPDFLLIDSRTGISEMSGITLSLLADDVVIVAANNKENLSGAKKIMLSITNPDNLLLDSPPKITFVLSRVPFVVPDDNTKEQNLISKIMREYFSNLIAEVNVIHSDRELEENEQIKIGYEKDGSLAQISRDYLNLFEKLTQDTLSKEEIKRFEDIKKAETLFVKAHNTKSYPEKIDLVTQAINLNPSNISFYYFRALLNWQLRQYEVAIKDCEFIIRASKFSPAYELLGTLLLSLDRFEDAENLYLELLKVNPKSWLAYNGLAIIKAEYYKDYEKSIELYNKSIDLNLENPDAFNGRGNSKRLLGKLEDAKTDVFKALELDPNHSFALATLAEINAAVGNLNEFYLNLEMALKLNPSGLEKAILKDKIYREFQNDNRFIRILERYNIVYSIKES